MQTSGARESCAREEGGGGWSCYQTFATKVSSSPIKITGPTLHRGSSRCCWSVNISRHCWSVHINGDGAESSGGFILHRRRIGQRLSPSAQRTSKTCTKEVSMSWEMIWSVSGTRTGLGHDLRGRVHRPNTYPVCTYGANVFSTNNNPTQKRKVASVQCGCNQIK